MRQSVLLLGVAALSIAAPASVRSEDVQSVEIVGPAAAEPPEADADAPAAAAPRYFAVVNQNGKLERGSAGVSSELFGFRGQYRVIFPKNVDTCGFVAAQARATAGGALPFGFTSAQSLSYDRHSIIVVTTDMAGLVKGRSFHVLVLCP